MSSSVAQQLQGLPSISTLTESLPVSSHQLSPAQRSSTAEPPRDSGTWPQPNSKHNSAASGLQVHTLLNPDDSPPRSSIPNTPQSARLPTSAISTASMLPSINQGFNDHGNRGSSEYPQALDSRRSSVDSRVHQFSNLNIANPASPYEGSANGSQVSLAASLRRPNGQTPLSPLSGRAGIRSNPPRQAPPIMPVGRMPGGPDPTAAKPTQGYAWAFPDSAIPEERRASNSDDSSVGPSRNNSFAASSIRSSVFSTDSQLPIGQRRFDEGAAHPAFVKSKTDKRADSLSTHHHSMQHRAIQSLQSEKSGTPGVGNYSRTPELRVSHKLAERKRRSEMKDLFEELNKAVPSNGGTKASKWEILTKAIDYIKSTQHTERTLHSEMQRLQRDADYARDAHKENEMLKTEISVMHQHLRRLDGNAPHVYGHFTSQLANQSASQTNGAASSLSLPPLNHPTASHYGSSAGAPAGAMQGVEYGAYGR
ncbi:hypothetical protein AMS68_002410 [Peltaster fructicola]|uniref:BHLH domain-containing protein n=1 Tax=Peltaster fructicola TaxID=286661 RepID=A0A6H0XQA8_9PEZI|nr:hypothetical protein AMS68_002410 [Peltaster fructicola]